MNLLFLRHGIAIDRDDPDCPASDLDRALTSEGRERLAAQVRGMRTLGIEFDRVVSSPLVRARETAEIVAAGYRKGRKGEVRGGTRGEATGTKGDAPAVEIADVLAPGMTPEALLRFLSRGFSRDATILLAGHEPDLSRAVAALAFGAAGETFSLKKGGLACVQLPSTSSGSRGTLLWLLTPQFLRAAGG